MTHSKKFQELDIINPKHSLNSNFIKEKYKASYAYSKAVIIVIIILYYLLLFTAFLLYSITYIVYNFGVVYSKAVANLQSVIN